MFEFFGIVADVAATNVADKTIGTSLFRINLLVLLPDNKYKDIKKEFYENLREKKYIIQEDATLFSNSGDKFNYKEKSLDDLEKYLKGEINKDPKTDNETISKILKYYDSNKSYLYWGGKKSKKTKSKHINKYKKTTSKRLHKKTLSKQI